MENFFQGILLWFESSKYILLFIGCIFEGPMVMIASGFLYGLGQFSLIPMYMALMMGDFTADVIWYCFGRFGTRKTIFKYGHFIGLTPVKLEKVENLFNKYHQKILIITKLTTGFGVGMLVLVVAGMFKVPFKNYVVLTLIGGLIWTAILITVGYFLGNIYAVIPKQIKIISIIIAFVSIIFILKYINNYLSKKEI